MELTWEVVFCLGIALLIHILIFIFVMAKRPKSIVGRHVVITGGSKGIGLCLAVECAMKGANVTVIARDEKMLRGAIALLEVIRQRPEQKFQHRSLDIGSDYDQVARVLGELEESVGDIYAMINCAGMAICGLFEEVAVEDVHKLMNVNFFGSYNCTRYVLPKMKKAGEGIIVLTSSQAAIFGIYGYGPYAASKYALRAMAETIAMESRSHGVSVTLALPCDTNTTGFEEEEKSKPRETKIISGGGGLIEPEVIAKAILKDALKGNFISIVGAQSWLITMLGGALMPWDGFFTNLLHATIIGPVRLLGYGLHKHFNGIIRKCAREDRALKASKSDDIKVEQ
ncbi:3-ketodihydrosphingosine reductase [Drosophila grimshawi]|uniref:3-dehydrosphinganine reductase n=1 Tax=Drosophila grimshawi TaxID=7222 RepID=B4JHJ9_DROGR|nr:3-ketodihydrosphingosine reductase [Drosophila grimshawi]EDV92826.1 GH18974 [Drosophila grimshawi]